ncbi:MAG: class II fructose-bisphosphate aldolase [Defluviitaleaceae bacterium]|nr:class II fructose-bisphosphate aldolase [Defluviitaleaceae bacterium]
MPAANLSEMLRKAKSGGYAVGAFNFNGYADLKGIIEAANECGAPVVCMASSGTVKSMGARGIACAFGGMALDSRVPCALHYDHGKDVETIRLCVEAGFTSVMIDASTKPFDENVEATRRVIEIAKRRDVSVEAELGTVAGREDDVVNGEAELIEPSAVLEFIERTGIDALAIGIGTVHGIYKQKPNIRFDLIERIAALTPTPLVMHGGTGLSEHDFKNAIERGICKVNVGTEIKNAFSRRLCELAESGGRNLDPRVFMDEVGAAAKSIVMGKLEIFGCVGKA